ncbi:hypothetical protein VOLCADRAFT_103642 [Volvox carteri f. nagariensis]|uniref:Tbc2 translation factor, chloroplastic n=1 Tax=Volvox carteri f. nagariensis TaxID=3068 RepID=D8TNK9_VOLCA|nr:uncharacterized protein VOLCADRAFT_103642 [Volvox carteri f. nagariensis]EFJ51008.1 hypothetical protein VOLCADRAFT_103642 [Volvox carteri f. nagariensis]|eukprot:XP_002948020.1 hypothetical protein VOLCADRAFT_103642 [Volvox carteri f. nagariensis]
MLDRQLSSAGCSTSCSAQQRPYRGSYSPERESSRGTGQAHRPLGSVVASATTASPPLSRHNGLHSLHPDLSTSIPDAIPSLEQLEDLRTRAIKASQARAGTLIRGAASVRGAKSEGTKSSSCGRPSRAGASAAQSRKIASGSKRPASHSLTKPPPAYRTMAIKSERNWRQLPGLLAEMAPAGRLDAFTASTFLTHLAQLVAKSPPVSRTDLAAIEHMQTVLLGSVEAWMHEYRARQISNMTWALARLGLPSGAAFVREHLLAASYPLLPWYEPQHLSNTLWALATIGVAPDDEWLEEYLTAAFVALQKRALAPQHLANVLWALERMGVMPDQEWMAAYYDCVQAAAPVANPQDCSNILSCLALMRMHQQQPAATLTLTDHLAQRLQALLSGSNGTASAVSAAVTPAAAADAAVLTPTPAHSAGGRLPEPAGAAVDVSDQAIANSLWALAIMGVQPSGSLWDAIMAALRQRLADPTRLAPGMHPVALTIILWASSTLGRLVPTAVTGLIYGRVRAPQMDAMEPRSLATMVWALATAPREQARPPPDWVADVVAVSGRSLAPMGAQAVSNLLYGLCQLGARPPPAWMSAVINHFHRNLGLEASGQSLSNVLWCLAKMGYRLNVEGMDILFGLVRSQLAAWREHSTQQQQQQQQQHGRKQQQLQALSPPPFNSQEISNVLYAIASMGYEIDPEGELAELLLDAVHFRLGEANAQELSNVMWCLAVLQIRPSQPWLDDYFTAAHSRLPTFKPVDLAQSLYGVAKLRLPLQPLPELSRSVVVRSPKCSAPLTATVASVDTRAVVEVPAYSETTSTATASSTSAATSWAAAALDAAPQLIASANAQDLCNLSWALVQLRVPVQPDSALVAAFTARLVALAGSCDPSQLALGVWALGKWRARPSKTHMERLELATFRQVPSMRPHELAAMLSGFTGMGHTAPAEWLSDAIQQVAARSREFGPQEWTMVVYALARIQNDTSLTEMVLRLLPKLDRLPLPSLILISYSCGCMGPSPMGRQLVSRCLALLAAGGAASPAGDRVTAATPGEATRRPRGSSTGRGFGAAVTRAPVVASADGTATVQPQRSAGSGAAAAAAAPDAGLAARPVAVSSLTPAELSALLWSAVRVGVKVMPRDFLDQFFSCTEPLLEELPASLLAAYLWAGGRLKMWLPSRWRQLLLRRVEAQLSEMRTRELAMCMAGLLWLRMWPTGSLLRKLRGCYEAQRDEMPERVRKHADTALAVLTKRLALAQYRERKYGCSRTTRLRWLARVWRGNLQAVAEGNTGYQGSRAAAAPPAGYVSRRRALQLGVLRRSAQRGKGTGLADKSASGQPAGEK